MKTKKVGFEGRAFQKMRAMYLERRTGPEGLTLGEIAKPSPKEGEVLVKVHATSVMPTEFSWYPTFNTTTGEPRPFPIVLSHELSGEVESVGANVDIVKIGDEAYGMNDWFTMAPRPSIVSPRSRRWRNHPSPLTTSRLRWCRYPL